MGTRVKTTLVKRAVMTLRTEGVRSTAWRLGRWLRSRSTPFDIPPLASVYDDDVLAVDWTEPRPARFDLPPTEPPYRVAWLISPPSRSSGGHQTAFRLMKYLEEAGHQVTIYLYAPAKYPAASVMAVNELMAEGALPQLRADISVYESSMGITDVHAIVASDWGCAYAAYRQLATARRFLFVQDFEPAFYAAGSDAALAENTYRFGFHGVTAGRWLARKLTTDYGMACDSFDFGVDASTYRFDNTEDRSEVVMYVRPPTQRRATEIGLLALRAFHALRPEVTINLVGWSMSDFHVPFPCVDHGIVDAATLNEIYNRCAAGLVLSMTNMSLAPMEMMASGVVPVINEADNTKGVFDDPFLEFVEIAPQAMAVKLAQILNRPDVREHAARVAQSVASAGWDDAGTVFVSALERVMRTGA